MDTCDCERDGACRTTRDSLELIKFSEWMTQSGDCLRSEFRRCPRCGAHWSFDLDLDAEPEPRVIARRKLGADEIALLSGRPKDPSSEAGYPPDAFFGEWKDPTGRVMEIFPDDSQAVRVNYAGSGGTYVLRDMPDGTRSLSRGMKAAMAGKSLVVELGKEGIGPTLTLDIESGFMVPRLGFGLCDDYEEGAGAPWVLPLRAFSRDA